MMGIKTYVVWRECIVGAFGDVRKVPITLSAGMTGSFND